MALQDRYYYKKLIKPDAFRLILLQPSAVLVSPIQCSLVTATLLEYDTDIVDHYTALSYVWGDEKDKRTINIDGKALEITATLESALRHIRDSRRCLRIWADGICINQLDSEEKNAQVAQMGSIYELARHTIIFLGEETKGSEAVMDAVCPTSRTSFDKSRGSELWLNVARRSALDSNLNPEANNEKLTTPASSQNAEWGNIRELAREHILQRAWFTRIWVLQELVLSPDPWIQVGTRRVRWNTFSDSLLYPQSPDELLGRWELFSDMHNARTKLGPPWLRETTSMCENYELLEILHSRRGLGVKDPRDMVYAHMGIMSINSDAHEFGHLIQVDYNKTTCDLYVDIAMYLLSSTKGFGFLSHVEDVPFENRQHHLPSWVPDWTSPYTSAEADMHLKEHVPLDNIELVHSTFQNSRVLGCVGQINDIIEEILEGMPPHVDLGAIFEAILGRSPDLINNISSAGREATKILHCQLSNWLGEERQYFWNNVGEFLIKERIKIYLERRPGPLPPVDRCQTDDQFQSDEKLSSYLLLGMTDTNGPGCFPGKKIARLQNRCLAMVPRTALVGDAVCNFNTSATTYVLRKATVKEGELDTKILKFFVEEKAKVKKNSNLRTLNDTGDLAAKKLLESLDISKVEHYTFVGECFADPSLDRAWFEPVVRSIFALH